MIIDDFYIFGASNNPTKDYSVLAVNPNTVLMLSITTQFFEVITWWNLQIFKYFSGVDHIKFALSCSMQVNWEQIARTPYIVFR
ncbi:MAG: hypothetical protein K940chlam9_00101 [Chlamydiae bacterium]|nr:hypothetical protein [Chlamydiota bacterium]